MTTDADLTLGDRELTTLLRLRLARSPHEEECDGLARVAEVAAGVAGAEATVAAGEHLQRCPSCAAALDLWRRLEAEPAVAPPQPDRPRILLRPAAWAAAVVACGMVLLWQLPDRDDEQLAVKGPGGDAFHVAVQRDNERFRLQPGQTLEDGDRLGFFYTASEPGYLALLSASREGRVSVLYPRDVTHAASIVAGSEKPLPDGGVFRRRADCEWLVAVFSDGPLPLAPLVESLRDAAAAADDDCALAFVAPRARTVSVLR